MTVVSYRVEYIQGLPPETAFVVEQNGAIIRIQTDTPSLSMVYTATDMIVVPDEQTMLDLMGHFEQWLNEVVLRRYGIPKGVLQATEHNHVFDPGQESEMEIKAPGRTVKLKVDLSNPLKPITIIITLGTGFIPPIGFQVTIDQFRSWRLAGYGLFH